MNVHVELAGFGQDRPAQFAGLDALTLAVPPNATLANAMSLMALGTIEGLSVMVNNAPVSVADRAAHPLNAGDHIVVLYVMEGG